MPVNKRKKKRRSGGAIVCNLQHCMYPIVHRCVRERGWVIAKRGEPFDIGISDNNQMIKELVRMRAHPRTIYPVQRVNHFPNMKQLYLKDCLADNLFKLFTELGAATQPIAPLSWCVPRQLKELGAHVRAMRARAGAADSSPVYIVKPAGGLQGHGIRLTEDPLENEGVKSGRNMVVQHYIDPPLLLDGFKFDLRLYVLVLSVDPLKVYVYNDGLVRLCTTKYAPPASSKSMADRNAHLTNYSLNKKSKNFVKGPDGSKRALKDVFATLKANGTDVDRLWTATIEVINTAILAVLPKLRHAYRKVVPKGSTLHLSTSTCYEVLGFDVMYDADLRPWLIEVNHAPSFRGGAKVDGRIKAGVIRQTLRMLRVTERHKKKLQGRCRKEWEKYMFDQAGCAPPSPSRPKTARGGIHRRASAVAEGEPAAVGAAAAASPDPEMDDLMDMCADGEPVTEEEDTAATGSAMAHLLEELSLGDAGGAPPEEDEGAGDGISSSSPEEAAVTEDESGISTDDGVADVAASPDVGDGVEGMEEEEDDDDDAEDGYDDDYDVADVGDVAGEAVTFDAPLPGTDDTFVKIFSWQSKRDKAQYAAIIGASKAAFAKEPAPLPRDVSTRGSADSPRRHSAPSGRIRRRPSAKE
mmetsp:Transcript_1968/g.4897  ORF Transcript_1968/g.4897 Transcript_1968/m.4897 type:complete len:638 (+) Transcript_1968:482-2395(+)